MADIGTAYIRVAPNMTGIQGKIAGGLKGSGSKFANQFGGEISGKSAVIAGAIAGVASAAVSKAGRMIADSIGDAVRRVDTLNAAARTFGFMGFKAEDAEKATSNLEKSILGLPTPLDSAMRGMTALAATYGDVDKGQKVFSALNNAVLGFGGTADMVDGAIAQLSKLPLDGPLDARTWHSLRANGLTPLLVAMAKESGMSVNELQKAFGRGELTAGDFNDMLLKMNKEGGGGLASLEKIAKSSTKGIGTSWANMQTAIVRGVANIIQAIGQENIANAIAAIGKGFESVLKLISNNLPKAIKTVKGFVDFVVRNKDVFGPLAVGIGAVVGAIIAWKTALMVWSAVTRTAKAIQAAFNVVMGLNPVTVITLAVIGLVAALVYFFTQTETGKGIIESFGKVVSGVWNGIKSGLQSVGNFFSKIWNGIKGIVGGVVNWIKSNWQLLLGILLGPMGIAVAMIIKHWDSIKNAFSSAWKFVTGLWGKAGDFFSGIFGKIKDAFKNIANIGKNIVTGLWDGMAGTGNWLKNKITDFVKDKIPGPIKKALGIASPSKVAAELGGEVSAGLAQGVFKKAGLVTRAVTDLADNAISSMAGMTVNPGVAANLGSSGSASAAVPAFAGAGGPQIVQNNSVYNQVDLDSVTRDLAWQVRR